MLKGGRKLFCAGSIMHEFLVAVIAAVIWIAVGTGAVVVPSTSCYALDNTSHIHDFSNLAGQLFEYEDGKEPDLVVRFCKDVETRSQEGYVDYGRFDKFNHFVASSGRSNFIQEYYDGDLRNCEKSFDKLGRTAEINIMCGNCPNGKCVGGLGCICNITYESACRYRLLRRIVDIRTKPGLRCTLRRVLIDLAIPCVKAGPRVFGGFTVGFHPRSSEIVYDGMTQLGYEKAYEEFGFGTEQRDVSLYLTAVSSLSDLVQIPTVKISPDQGLDVRLSGSGANDNPPTTLSPTMILVSWRCEKVSDKPYEVNITIPVENYDPIQFTFAKICEHRQNEHSETTRGWAVFGILACILFIGFTLFCCGGFIYRARMQNMRGLDAVPGMAILSACLETASGGTYSYTQAGDGDNPFVNQAPSHPPASTQGTWTASGRTYGSI